MTHRGVFILTLVFLGDTSNIVLFLIKWIKSTGQSIMPLNKYECRSWDGGASRRLRFESLASRPLPSPHPPGQVWALPLPVVVSIVPVVKVHQEAAVHHVGHTGHTDEGRVHAIDSLQLHAHLEAQGWGTLGARGGAATARARQASASLGPTSKERSRFPRSHAGGWGLGWGTEVGQMAGGRNRQNYNLRPQVTQNLLASKVYSEEASLWRKMSDPRRLATHSLRVCQAEDSLPELAR